MTPVDGLRELLYTYCKQLASFTCNSLNYALYCPPMSQVPYKITLQTQRKGGKARALALSPTRRSQIAREGAKARWQNHRKKAAA